MMKLQRKRNEPIGNHRNAVCIQIEAVNNIRADQFDCDGITLVGRNFSRRIGKLARLHTEGACLRRCRLR
jgi:hypothetical protein